MKRSRRSSFEDAVGTVRRLIELIDEISQIQYIAEQKLSFLRKYRKECETQEPKHPAILQDGARNDTGSDRPVGTMKAMIDTALEEIEEDNTGYEQYLRDLKSNLDVVFHDIPNLVIGGRTLRFTF